ncbi:leucine-rich repeat protein 1 [Ixodes scapularis]|uniref:leucine-rich repeat protein 1 n=1 Tax=Ixodes scapularis TaxID=6945 RepID=UPI001A9D7C32|nr:leucine-rich repeat protein 1 [Ixodes scapularis]
MRLNCETEIHYRLVNGGGGPTPTQCKRRAAYSTLTLTRHPVNKSPFLYLNTVKDPCGTKYRVDGNIAQVFTRCVCEGRARISFHDPKHDVVIKKADPVNLRGFLTLLGRLVRGQPVECADLSQPPTKVTPVKSSMVVAKKGDYPSRFPDTLKTLTARGCSLARVGREVTSLERLSHLDLGENCLREIPAALGDLPLRRLVLAGNEMRAFPERLFEGRVRDTLEELDVSQNELFALPPGLCRLPKLATLLAPGNNLRLLPDSLGSMQSLRKLELSDNALQYLPGSVVELKLDWLSLSDNPMDGLAREFHVPSEVPSLVALAGCVTVATGAQLTAEDVPRELLRLLWASGRCRACRAPVFPDSAPWLRASVPLRTLVRPSGVLVHVLGDTFQMPLRVLACSRACLRKQEHARV